MLVFPCMLELLLRPVQPWKDMLLIIRQLRFLICSLIDLLRMRPPCIIDAVMDRSFRISQIIDGDILIGCQDRCTAQDLSVCMLIYELTVRAEVALDLVCQPLCIFLCRPIIRFHRCLLFLSSLLSRMGVVHPTLYRNDIQPSLTIPQIYMTQVAFDLGEPCCSRRYIHRRARVQ